VAGTTEEAREEGGQAFADGSDGSGDPPDPFAPGNAREDMPADPTTVGPPEEGFHESLSEELGALIDDGRTYFEAELAFQSTRAKLIGRNAGIALGLIVVAVVVLHVAVLAFAVGMVMALEPLVTIWGAIAIVVGALILVTALLGLRAARHGKRIAAMFEKPAEASKTGNSEPEG
jgi:hypothetical protein